MTGVVMDAWTADVVAPGVSILSARTQALAAAEPKVDDKSGAKATGFNKLVRVSSGTSMSTAVVSGAMALFRQALRGRGFQLALSIVFEDRTLARARNTSVQDPNDARKDRMLNNNAQKLVVRDIQSHQFPVNKERSILAHAVVTSLRICDNPVVKKTPGANLKTPLPFAVVWKVWYT